MKKQDIIAEVITEAGGMHALGKKLNISYQAIQSWKKLQKIPADRVIAIEEATGIPREKLRPDLYR